MGRTKKNLFTHTQSKQLFKQCDIGVDERASELKILPSAVPQDLKFPQSLHRSSNGNSCVDTTGISMGSSFTKDIVRTQPTFTSHPERWGLEA